ncbi:MAG: hypothetical protein OEY64_03105 [Nitrospinota bacterium]|nr:hypothetical protein [Nitrospinota bacterium]
MKLGTKTLLFGVHQVVIHPLLVTIAWCKLYKSFPSFKELVCIIIHDWGYWGKASLKCEDGDRHPELGAKIAGKLFGPEWSDFILGHSSFYIVRHHIKRSKLLAPDKYWHCFTPFWFYRWLSVPTGEMKHYRELGHARQVARFEASDEEWYEELKRASQQKVDNCYQIDKERLA